jgi:hypothetical protein
MLGYAATTDVRDVPIVVVDGRSIAAQPQLLERLAASPYFDIVREELSPSRVESDLAQGRVWLAVVIPPGFGNAIERADVRGSNRPQRSR